MTRLYFCFMYVILYLCFIYFFLNSTATTEIYTDCHTLSLHYALPIDRWGTMQRSCGQEATAAISASQYNVCNALCSCPGIVFGPVTTIDRKSTRLNSRH